MASTREWFETVEEARRRAQRHLPKGRPSVHDLSPDDVIIPAEFARGVSK